MKPTCDVIQERLAEEGPQALRDDAGAQRHLEECDACFLVLEGLSGLDSALAGLAAVDAPDGAVEAVVAAVQTTRADVEPLTPMFRLTGGGAQRRIMWATAASIALVALTGGTALVLRQERLPETDRPAFQVFTPPATTGPDRVAPPPAHQESRSEVPGGPAFGEVPSPSAEQERLKALGYLGFTSEPASDPQKLTGGRTTPTDPRSDLDQNADVQKKVEDRRAQLVDALRRAEDGDTRSSNGVDAYRQVGAEEAAKQRELDDQKRQTPGDSEVAQSTVPAEARDEDHGADGNERARANDKPKDIASHEVIDAEKAGSGKADQSAGGEHAASGGKVASTEVTGVPGGVVGGVVGGVEGGIPGGVAGTVMGGVQSKVAAVRVGGQIKEPRLVRRVAPVYPAVARKGGVQGVVVLEVEVDATGKVSKATVLRSVPQLDAAAIAAVKQWIYEPTLLNGVPVPVLMTVTLNFRLDDASPEPVSDNAPAPQFLAERARTDVPTQAAAGYWANTYVPGDPALRILQARLATWDRRALAAQTGLSLHLHDAAQPSAEPFDAPARSGLAVFLRGDRSAATGPQRMLVEVGLQASARQGGPRPPLTVALVLDLRGEISPETAGDLRALVLAFAASRTAGDRFSLTAAGRPGAVGPDAFRHGQVAVAFDQMLAAAPTPDGDLAGAVAAAYRQVGTEDAAAAIGSREVVLVTPGRVGNVDALADLAHQGAVAGIPLTAVGVGAHTSLPELDGLALAGQGSRRQLASRAEAPRLVDAELAAASDVVARAARLRIRLAPGVRLVEVVGSHRLDAAQAQRVREAERSIDLGLSRQLGIEADRGDDEDGIQIVLPRVQAGDAHVVLLDVIVPGPGPVADVAVRFKDLVSLGNGTARAALALPRGEPGPLDRTVLRDLLALRLAQTLTRAAACVDAGDPRSAHRLVEDARALRRGLLAGVPGLGSDAALLRDVALLGEYASLLEHAAAPPHFAFIADSLRCAGRLRQLARPAVS